MGDSAPERVEWRRETITAPTADVLRRLYEHKLLEGAYLGGGTGLALRFGHRRSIDLDFFSRDQFDEEALLQRLQEMPEVSVNERRPQTLHLVIQGVKVSFLGYTYPLLFSPAPFLGAPVADPRDIACMKIAAIASRGAKRDFIDLYAACERFGLGELLDLFARKYARVAYSRLHSLKSLTYFADAEKDPMPHMLVPLDWGEVRRFFEREALRFG
jgi:predicted nucleotidyltransferase component of viral defense system